ncbi:MAG: hypothetical protein AAF798_06380 [Bacteroidota bacterium]
MTKLQWSLVGGSILLFAILYFGCERKDPNLGALEKTRALQTESTDIKILLQEARSSLSVGDRNSVLVLEDDLAETLVDSAKIDALKKLSGKWFDFEQYAIAGYYAQEIATLDEKEESWSIAGTTYTICLQRSTEERIRSFCTGRAITAFENAISLNPEEMRHRVNLALCYAENPPQANPMQGIQMLLELNQNDPDNVLVLNTLGRLAIRTGQYDRAIERLTRANQLQSDNRTTICLLAQAYDGKGDSANAANFAAQCRARLN